MAGISRPGRLKLCRYAFRQPGNVGMTECRDGNFPILAVNRHRFERWLISQRVRDRTHDA